MRDLDKFRGCLIGGAIGDALGYAVEFKKIWNITEEYGPNGITRYDLFHGVARISDDTQMTLFTAVGLLFGMTRGKLRGIGGNDCGFIHNAYLDWLVTQEKAYGSVPQHARVSWLLNCPELFASRAPGNTCLSALESGKIGTVEKPINDSKGCGGVMRVAPIGLYFVDHPHASQQKIDRIGADAAAITHGHELGYIPAAALVHIITKLASGQCGDVLSAVEDALNAMPALFPDARYMEDFLAIMKKAIALSQQEISDLDAICQLGEGWVAEETLAIAVYCALKHSQDFEKAIIAAVNHNGDSDSTGAVTGNILGAFLGYEALPDFYVRELELKDLVLEVADDLYHDCQMSEYSDYSDPIWESKYLYLDYAPGKEIK